MKKACVLLITMLIVVLSCGGCSFFAQPGETAAEGNRRHIRTLDINRAEFMADVDRALQLERPSRLTDLRIR